MRLGLWEVTSGDLAPAVKPPRHHINACIPSMACMLITQGREFKGHLPPNGRHTSASNIPPRTPAAPKPNTSIPNEEGKVHRSKPP